MSRPRSTLVLVALLVSCSAPRAPHRDDGGADTTPDCSACPADTYQVSATTFWTVEWSGGGESGVIAQSRSSGVVPVQINELQVVTR